MKKSELSIKKLKKERGSVTLFVLITMLLFLIILFTCFTGIKNKLIEQEKEIAIIQNEYNASDIDQKYDETVDNLDLNVSIALYKETGEVYSLTEWTNQNLKLQIFYPDDVAERYFYIDGVKTPYTDGYLITENCTISAEYKNKTKQARITRIDKKAPTVQIFQNGADIKVSGETGTINVQVKGTDNASGIKEIKYAWSTENTKQPTEDQYQTIQNGGKITQEYPLGTYYLWIKATDIAGNVTDIVSNSYTIREPLPPTVTMRYKDTTGELYTGKWTNQDIYTEITMPKSEGNVEKYQYSIDGLKWIDIDEEQKAESIDYTPTFPLNEDSNKPSWIDDLISVDNNNYFVTDENTIKSSNKNNSTNAKSYIKIDLTKFTDDDELNININAQVSSESNYDWGYVCITENSTPPTFNKSSTMSGEILKISGSISAKDYTTTITGGKIYYLHFGYYKDSSASSGTDTFTINSLNFVSESLGKSINFVDYSKIDNIVTYTITEEIDKNLYFRALYDDSTYSKVSELFSIKIDKTAPEASFDYDFTGKDKSNITISNIIEKGSGLRGYYISTNEEIPTKESSWIETSESIITIENLLADTNYYVWLIDNAGNISNAYSVQVDTPNYLVDNTIYTKTLEQAIANASDGSEIKILNDYTDDSIATINKNITLDIQNYTLTRTKVISINSEKQVTIIGNGTLTSNTNNYTISNSGILNVNIQGKIESTTASTSYGVISNSGTLNVNSGNIEGYYGIYNNNSSVKINIHGGTVVGTGAYGIYGYGTTTINGGYIKGKTRGIYQYSGTLTVNDGNIEGDYGIYQSSNATANILGGKVEGKTCGVYGSSTNKITIGDINLEVSDKTPIVSGGLYGIYMSNTSYTYNFNNGIIMGTNTIPYTETVVPREGYMVYTYYDYNSFRKYCSVLTTTVSEITIEQQPTEWTNQNVEILVKYPILAGTTLQFSEDGETWKDVNNGYRTNIMENKTVYARMLDTSGILIEKAEHEVTNIDKIAPVLSITPETTKYIIYNHESDSVDISATVTLSDEGGSGLNIAQYGWSNSKEEQPTKWTDFNSGDTITKEKCDVGTYYLWFNISDNAGNVSDIDVIRYIVELQEAVAKIEDTYYYTIQDAIDDAGTTPSTVEIIKDTDEISTVQEGQNIILDLQGHTVGSSTSDQAVFTSNGTLTIIDTSEEQTGTIENLIGTSIINNGTLTIGNNDSIINDNTPTISGKKKGIENNNTLNYYDGTIIGKIAIEGEVQETPERYGPVGVYESGMTTVNLRVISDYVARIEWFYYTTLQSAIDACEAREKNTKQTTVVMLKDIVLEEGANVYIGQNVRLNLNSYTLTSLNDSVITNYGKLEIADLSEEQIGTIMSSIIGTSDNYYKLINNQKELIISGGNITTDKNCNYPIYNKDGMVNITGGAVSSSAYGIYNNGTGKIKVDGGTVSGITYAIYNKETGTINVNGGTVSGRNYGIYNEGLGTINVHGGTVSSRNSSSWDYNYGIYNEGLGTINVNGGTVSSTNKSGNSYGIYNEGLGTINVDEGTISSSNSKYLDIGVYNERAGTINVNGGTVSSTSTSENGSSYGILNCGIGTINVHGGTVSSSSKDFAVGVYNEGAGTINVNNGTIISSGNSSAYGIYNKRSGTINVNKGTISSSSKFAYGIYNNGSGTINAHGGTVSSSSSYGYAYGMCNTLMGIINVGTKGDGIVSNIEPSIKSEYTGTYTSSNSYGIYNEGELHFYDGIIQGNNRFGIGGITDIEEGYQIKEDTINGYSTIYLEEKQEIYIVRNEKINKEYSSLQEAIDESPDNEETKLQILKDFDLITKCEISENKVIILDLAGNAITNKYYKICNSGNLTIEDSIGKGNIMCQYTRYGIKNNGELSLNGGTVSSSSRWDSSTYGIYNEGLGIINVNGGTVSSTNKSGNSYGIYNNGSGTINVHGGTVSSSSDADYAYGIYNSIGTINVHGGTVSSSSSYYASAYGIYNSTGTINVHGGTVSSSKYGIYNSGAGTINVHGGTVSSSSYGICNSGAGTINVNGGTVSSSGSGNVYGIYDYGAGTTNIGTKGDGIVSNIEPNIKAEYIGTSTSYGGYGIYNQKGELYFYDGRIEGSTLAVETNSKITEREENTEFLYENSNRILTLTTEAMDIAKIGDITYSSLQDAIDAAGTNSTTIELLRGIQYTNQDVAINIAQDQNITLDLKGFSIISAIEDAVITNNGKLKITDSSKQAKGKISGSFEKTIYNKQDATLELNGGTITRIETKDNVVYNEGIVNVTGATISQPEDSRDSVYPIYNTEGATLNINEGTISGGRKGVYNIGYVNVINGTIKQGIDNTGSGSLKIENGTINGTIENSGNASIEMAGGNIQLSNLSYSKKYGIKNTSTNTINITGGTISVSATQSSYAIYSTAGTINIGTKDGTIAESPVITGSANGIYSTGTLNIYDGIIKGKTSAIGGEINNIEDKCEINVSDDESGYETVKLIKVDTPIAQVGSEQYYSLKESIESISDTGTVTILREGTVEQMIDNLSGKDVTLDLNGNTLKMYSKIQNAGTLALTDTSSEKTGILKSYKDSPIYNSGNLSLLDGNISGNSYGIYNQTNGTTEIVGGNLAQNTYGVYAVGGIVNVTNGKISNNNYGTFCNGGTINISGGNITNNEYGIYNSIGTTNVTEGTINTNTYGIYNGGTGTTNIRQITLTGNTNEVYNGGTGTVNIISGNIITSSETAIENASTGTIAIGTQDGNVTLDSPLIQSEAYGINNSGKGTIKFYDGTIKGRKGGLAGLYLYLETGYKVKTDYIDEYYCDILALSGTISTVAKIGSIEYTNLQSAINACTSDEATIITLVNSINTNTTFVIEEEQNIIIDLNGKNIISGTAESTVQNAGNLTIIDMHTSQTGKISNSYAVAINNSGTLTLGQNDGTVSTTCPDISGNTYGIINTGAFNFYDGIIRASRAIDGTITSRADNYIINKTTSDGIEQLVLSR